MEVKGLLNPPPAVETAACETEGSNVCVYVCVFMVSHELQKLFVVVFLEHLTIILVLYDR